MPRLWENQHFWAWHETLVVRGGREAGGCWVGAVQGTFSSLRGGSDPRVLPLPAACCSGGRARGDGRWSVTRRRLLLLTSPHHVLPHPRPSCTPIQPLLLTFLHPTLISALPHHALHTPALLLHAFSGDVLFSPPCSSASPFPLLLRSPVRFPLRPPQTCHFPLHT